MSYLYPNEIFTLERTAKKSKLEICRASNQGIWFSVFKTDLSKCLDFYMTNEESIQPLRKLNKDLNIFEDTL